MPPTNPYLPASFAMLPPESASDPRPVLNAERAVGWAATEVSLKEPRVSLIMNLQVPWADADVESYMINDIMIKVVGRIIFRCQVSGRRSRDMKSS